MTGKRPHGKKKVYLSIFFPKLALDLFCSFFLLKMCFGSVDDPCGRTFDAKERSRATPMQR